MVHMAKKLLTKSEEKVETRVAHYEISKTVVHIFSKYIFCHNQWISTNYIFINPLMMEKKCVLEISELRNYLLKYGKGLMLYNKVSPAATGR